MGEKDKTIVELCERIYRENKNAIDLINECREDYKPALFGCLQTVLEERDDIKIYNTGKNTVICLPKNISNFEKLRFSNWEPENFVVHLHFMNCCKGHKNLCFEILFGPANDENSEKRKNLIEYIEKELNLKFNNKKGDWTYSSPINLFDPNEYYEYESLADITGVIRRNLETAKTLYIDKLAETINSAVSIGILD